MTRFYNKFEFVGNLSVPKEENFVRVQESASGWIGHRMNFAVQETQNSGVFVELYGGYFKSKANYPIKTFSKGSENVKGDKLEIPWESRLEKSVVRQVADFKKIVVDLTDDPKVKAEMYTVKGEIRKLEYKDELTSEEQTKLNELYDKYEGMGNRKEFLHAYDAIQFLQSELPDVKGKQVIVRGQVTYNRYNDKVYRKFDPQTITLVTQAEDADPIPNKLRATLDVFFTKGAVDEKDFNKDKVVYIEGYVLDYDGTAKKDVFFPQQLVLNGQKLDFSNPKHEARFNYFKKQFDVKDKKKVYHQVFEVSIFRGADEVELTEKDLTDAQREQIEFGLATLETFQKKVYGETKEETRIVKNLLEKFDDHNDFTEGVQETDYDVEDLDAVPVPAGVEDVLPEALSNTTVAKVEMDDLDDLFG